MAAIGDHQHAHIRRDATQHRRDVVVADALAEAIALDLEPVQDERLVQPVDLVARQRLGQLDPVARIGQHHRVAGFHLARDLIERIENALPRRLAVQQKRHLATPALDGLGDVAGIVHGPGKVRHEGILVDPDDKPVDLGPGRHGGRKHQTGTHSQSCDGFHRSLPLNIPAPVYRFDTGLPNPSLGRHPTI